ncbi:hypothetical protein NW072_02575 [Mycoplasmopsis felis]|uniref:hypothetical protein n=1 Tax=Mycoplasmopsis felis TaxID=33923 RepID=UPI0021AFE68C|nr:hypothetical protein [Mycoplasmopsis felis]UWV80003.1 hypothetical protein NW072_02575 [Mycoplasmopsis felis]
MSFWLLFKSSSFVCFLSSGVSSFIFSVDLFIPFSFFCSLFSFSKSFLLSISLVGSFGLLVSVFTFDSLFSDFLSFLVLYTTKRLSKTLIKLLMI